MRANLIAIQPNSNPPRWGLGNHYGLGVDFRFYH
ncbi:MAG: hypothetical protein RLZZ511_1711 [Cyanobacteriota bacterium]|jgi:hypothetical protein